MKRIVTLSVILLIITGLPLFAAGIRDERLSESKTSVWLITSENNTMFLGGSIHILRESDFPLPRNFDYAFSQSDILILEADTKQMESPEIIQYLMDSMFLPVGTGLQSILNKEVYELLSAACMEYGIVIDDIGNLKPAMIMNILTLFQMEKYGFVQEGVDDYYYNKADYENKPIDFLESVQSQIDMILTMGDGYENEYVLYSLQDMEYTGALLNILLAQWKIGASSITELTLTEMKEHWPEIYKSLITDRHDLWLPQIEHYLTSDKVYFVIVGLAHIHGPDGLLKYLEDLGYEIEQL
ncbi:MAG: TraB/GumN family protein, partial [Treponema sp.]|nr:TraB/GumN family protein [Treponema sp.]